VEPEATRVGRHHRTEQTQLAELVERGRGEPIRAVVFHGRRPELALDELTHSQGHESPLLGFRLEGGEGTQAFAMTLEEIPRDDGPLDLVGALPDHHQRRIAIEPFGYAGRGRAATPQDAKGAGGSLLRALRGAELGHARLALAALAPVLHARRPP